MTVHQNRITRPSTAEPNTIHIRSAKPRTDFDAEQLKALRRRAREQVREFLWVQSADKRRAEKCTKILHGPICMYEASRHRLKLHRRAGMFVYERLIASNSAIASLKRLQRHAATGGYHWAKAWAEMTPAAKTAILSVLPAGSSMPIGSAPNPDFISPYIPAAMRKARLTKVTTSERDRAVIAILQAYIALYGKKPPSPKGQRSRTPWFIAQIEKAYREMLPAGFGVSRSKATLDRLIKLAGPGP